MPNPTKNKIYIYISMLIKPLIGSLIIKTKKMTSFGQMLSEYGITLALVAASVIAATTYVRRGVQGRYKNITDSAIDTIVAAHTLYTAERMNYPLQYEPYYLDSIVKTGYNLESSQDYEIGGESTKTKDLEFISSEAAKKVAPYGSVE